MNIGNTWSWQGAPGSKQLAMARSTWSQRCCTATSSACSCTSAGRSASCSSSPWCPPPASPATTPCNQTFWKEGEKGRSISIDCVFYLVCLKVLQRLIAFDELLLKMFDGFLQLAHLLRQLSMRSVVARLHLRPLFEETHERVAFSVPFYIFFIFFVGQRQGKWVVGRRSRGRGTMAVK